MSTIAKIVARMRMQESTEQDAKDVLKMADQLEVYANQVTSNVQLSEVNCACERVGIRCIECGKIKLNRQPLTNKTTMMHGYGNDLQNLEKS